MTGDDGELSSVRRNGKSEAAFRTISEVSEELDVPQHVLRFWEGKFPQVKPLKRGGGRRYYRPDDVALLRRIRDLLYSEGYTIRGVQKLLKEGGAVAVRADASPEGGGEAELGLPLGIPDADPTGDDIELDGSDDDTISDSAPVNAVAPAPPPSGALVSHAPTEGGLAPETRKELESLLAELEQLRILLQPR